MNKQVAKDILELTTFSDSFMFLVLGIMIISGILGGLVNFFLTENHKPPVWKAVLGYCLLGIVASFTVPLFLNMVSSNLLVVAPRKPANLFIFNGICLLFALFSCRLKEHIDYKRLKGFGDINKDDVKTDPIEADYDLKTGCQNVSQDRIGRAGISKRELKIIQVMADKKYVHRSLVSLLKDPELADEKVNETLSSLIAKGLVEQKLNRESKLRLYLTPKGKQLLGNF